MFALQMLSVFTFEYRYTILVIFFYFKLNKEVALWWSLSVKFSHTQLWYLGDW